MEAPSAIRAVTASSILLKVQKDPVIARPIFFPSNFI